MPRKKTANIGPCSREGCDKPSKTIGLCSMHYCRFSRYGSFERIRTRKKSYIHTKGYIVEHMPGHALSNSSDEVFQHRRVFYDKHGEGPFNCFGCSLEVSWGELHIDHIDDCKTNNIISNLRASCPGCNTERGRWKLNDLMLDRFGISYQGKLYTINQLAKIKGMSGNGLRARIQKMGIDKAMEIPKVFPSDPRPWRFKPRDAKSA